VVSTYVGMAPDLITDGVSGGLVQPDDVAAIAERAMRILSLPDGASALKKAARESVMVADWSVVARRHIDEVWKPLMQRSGA
jgi:glycosyltransferase involved in cell wall biosynthesis